MKPKNRIEREEENREKLHEEYVKLTYGQEDTISRGEFLEDQYVKYCAETLEKKQNIQTKNKVKIYIFNGEILKVEGVDDYEILYLTTIKNE